ncbi:FlgO family outer membrane protein [uncultured Endozoicomonas sp.]|uniref:FlgO family outer membrane protein n=1 Tax=uncultured Endozoicomonas sp. TaxID=432652 RepID=UPI002626E94E|nr:FlgO family outer membrane protein [uncultured Endozoicomonas sp.]
MKLDNIFSGKLFTVLFTTLIITGCSTGGYKKPKPIDLVGISQKAAVIMAEKAKNDLPAGATILSTSLADINQLSKTTPLGRVLGEQLSSGLSDIGYSLIEIKMRDSVFISNHNGGEFSLSRNLDNLSKTYKADAIVTGTYAIGSHTVYISARMIDTSSKHVISTADFQIPLDSDIRVLTSNRRY